MHGYVVLRTAINGYARPLTDTYCSARLCAALHCYCYYTATLRLYTVIHDYVRPRTAMYGYVGLTYSYARLFPAFYGYARLCINVLARKPAFLDFKKIHWKKSKNWHFSKGVQEFCQNFEISSSFLFRPNRLRKRVSYRSRHWTKKWIY